MGVTATTGESSEQREIFEVNDQVVAMLNKIEPNDFPWFNPQTQKEEQVYKWRWHFMVLDDGPWKGEEITGDTSTKFVAHPDCKAFRWASAIKGSEYPVGAGFNSDEITGMQCRILIGHKPSKKSEMIFMTVTDVMAPRATAAQLPPVAQPAPPFDPAVDGAQF
jgi:hypothetical protein